MIGKTKERWQELCELAEKEQDPDKLIDLVKEINRLLEEKQSRLAHLPKQYLEPDLAFAFFRPLF